MEYSNPNIPIQILVSRGLEVATEHDGDVVRDEPDTGSLENFLS